MFIPSYEEVFTFEHLWVSYWKCRTEVGWKPSLQIFQQNLTTEIVMLLDELHSEVGFVSDGFIEFNICERGKMRHIKSVSIKERIVRRCFCDYYLVPLLTRDLVYDNGVSLSGKGITFALNRLEQHLHAYYNKYHTNEGYILMYDFSNFFGNIDHEILYSQVDPLMLDDKCRKLYHHLVDAFGDVGLGLGSQVSQVSAIAYPNAIDHFFENESDIEDSARYMDDGYVICHTKEQAERMRERLFEQADLLKIKINPKKVKIVKINRSFIFLKKRFFLSNSGQVVVRLNRNNIYKHRRRIKKLVKLVEKGVLAHDDLVMSHKAWIGQLTRYKNWESIHDMDIQIRRILEDDYRADFTDNQCCLAAA